MKCTCLPPFFIATRKYNVRENSPSFKKKNDCSKVERKSKKSYKLFQRRSFMQRFSGSLLPPQCYRIPSENHKCLKDEEHIAPTPIMQCSETIPVSENHSSTSSNSKETIEPTKSSTNKQDHLHESTSNVHLSRDVTVTDKTNDSIIPKISQDHQIRPQPSDSYNETQRDIQKREGVSSGSVNVSGSRNKMRECMSTNEIIQSQISETESVNVSKYEKSEKSKNLIKNALMKNKCLREGLRDKEVMQAVVDAMYMEERAANSYIIEEGTIGLHLYVCEEGTLEVYKEEQKVNTLGSGKIFGELALLYNTKRNASVKAITPCVLWVLQRNVFSRIVRDLGMKRIEKYVAYLHRVPLFKSLDREVLVTMTDLLKVVSYSAGEIIIKQGEEGNLFYIINEGTVVVTRKATDGTETMRKELKKGDFFGEHALLPKENAFDGKTKRTATVTAKTNVECLILDREPFIQFLGELDEVQEVVKRRNAELMQEGKKNSEYSNIRLQDLEVKGTLGIGGFGRVELVSYRNNQELTFALKKLKKSHIEEFRHQDHILNEKATLLCCNSPFIAKLYNTYKDDKYLYFLTEACLGGDVWTLLHKKRVFDNEMTKFIAACVVEAFHYLHDRGIVYRDLKPENLLFNAKGYVKLVDFGFAKKLNKAEKTWTFAGTPEYLAPEIIRNKGHDRGVDYWGLGILIYELLVGKPPFRGDDHIETYYLILQGISEVTFPSFLIKSAENIVKKLCKDEQAERLGCQKDGVNGIKNHKWFADFNWIALEKCEMVAPFIPNIRGPTDLSNFDDCPKDKEIPPDMFCSWEIDF